jgi:hypothetical protein
MRRLVHRTIMCTTSNRFLGQIFASGKALDGDLQEVRSMTPCRPSGPDVLRAVLCLMRSRGGSAVQIPFAQRVFVATALHCIIQPLHE